MAIIALTAGEDRPYILIRDRDSEEPTVFKLTGLDLKQERFINSIIMKGRPAPIKGKGKSGDKNKDAKMVEYSDNAMDVALHLGLGGADNFNRGDGTPAKWERNEKAMCVYGDTKPWTDETLMQIKKGDRTELSTEIMGISEEVTAKKKELEKNL